MFLVGELTAASSLQRLPYCAGTRVFSARFAWSKSATDGVKAPSPDFPDLKTQMNQYLVKRALHGLFSLCGLIVLVFFLARLTGDPTHLYLPLDASLETRAEFREKHGLNEPLWLQFSRYAHDLSRLDFGLSMRRQSPALGAVLNAFPYTLILSVSAMGTSLVLAIVLGSMAARKPNGFFDRCAGILSLGGASAPDFWVAIMGVLFFAVFLGWLPTSGVGGPLYWILPIGTLMIKTSGPLIQVVRGSMISQLAAQYIVTARAKGMRERRLIFVHALKGALLATITVAGDQSVGLVNGAVVVETVFGWPGIGKLMIDAILQRDFTVVQAAVMTTAVTIFAMNIAIDLLYMLIDPRVRVDAEG